MIRPLHPGAKPVTRLFLIALTLVMATPYPEIIAASDDEDEDVRRYRGPLP